LILLQCNSLFSCKIRRIYIYKKWKDGIEIWFAVLELFPQMNTPYVTKTVLIPFYCMIHYPKNHLYCFFLISKLCLLNTSQTKFKGLLLRRKLFIWTAVFRFNGSPLLHQRGYCDVIHSQALECSVWTQLIYCAKHESWRLKAQNLPCCVLNKSLSRTHTAF